MSKETLDLVREKEKEGKIVFHTIEGIVSADLEAIIEQPAEGLLYDLNRDKVTCASFIASDKDDSSPWLNNYATAMVIEKLKEIIGQYQPIDPKDEPPKDRKRVLVYGTFRDHLANVGPKWQAGFYSESDDAWFTDNNQQFMTVHCWMEMLKIRR